MVVWEVCVYDRKLLLKYLLHTMSSGRLFGGLYFQREAERYFNIQNAEGRKNICICVLPQLERKEAENWWSWPLSMFLTVKCINEIVWSLCLKFQISGGTSSSILTMCGSVSLLISEAWTTTWELLSIIPSGAWLRWAGCDDWLLDTRLTRFTSSHLLPSSHPRFFLLKNLCLQHTFVCE